MMCDSRTQKIPYLPEIRGHNFLFDKDPGKQTRAVAPNIRCDGKDEKTGSPPPNRRSNGEGSGKGAVCGTRKNESQRSACIEERQATRALAGNVREFIRVSGRKTGGDQRRCGYPAS